jgi:hypothetical protein
MFTTGGVVTDDVNIGPNDMTAFYVNAPTDARLPNGGGQRIGPLYNKTRTRLRVCRAWCSGPPRTSAMTGASSMAWTSPSTCAT